MFDSTVYHIDNDENKCMLKILMNQGDYLFLDTIDLTETSNTKYDAHVNTCLDKYYMAYGFNWPYFSYAS